METLGTRLGLNGTFPYQTGYKLEIKITQGPNTNQIKNKRRDIDRTRAKTQACRNVKKTSDVNVAFLTCDKNT